MSVSISISLALTMAGPAAKTSTQRKNSTKTPLDGRKRAESTREREFTIYKGVSDRPLGWKPREAARTTATGQMGRDVIIRKWDGAVRRSIVWDDMRRDPELWFPKDSCLVHLYGFRQSRRGPAFQVSLDILRAMNCQPLINRYLVEVEYSTPISFSSCSSRTSYFDRPSRKYELYIPAPQDIERGQAYLYHTATRNFFAWMFEKSLVGNHLGGALVGLLNSMNEFRNRGEDNVQAIMDYMDEEGYGDMRNQPDHALGILFFAEHFRFRDLWIDAFAHCCGMHERLTSSPGFEFISRASRALITRSRLEMDMRLGSCGRRLGTFLSDDLSEAHLGLSAGARAHLDDFRSFLQAYYVAKLGYYPPTSSSAQNATFPKHIFGQMCAEFEKLYDFLVDDASTLSSPITLANAGGIRVQQVVERFDQRHRHNSLIHPLPRLPEIQESPKPPLKKRFSFLPKKDKLLPDPRLVTYAALTKATNNRSEALLDCSLVRAYRGFERECVFFPSQVSESEKLSQSEARKVRWILIYSVLQTLLSATEIPEQVTDTHNVPYNLCVLTGGCRPWSRERPYETFLCTQSDQVASDYLINSTRQETEKPIPPIHAEIRPDVDHLALLHKQKPPHSREDSDSTLRPIPSLLHPKPHRASYHEILVQGYGNGTSMVHISGGNGEAEQSPTHSRKSSSGSSVEDSSYRWSNSSIDPNDLEAASPHTSVASHSRGGSEASGERAKLKGEEGEVLLGGEGVGRHFGVDLERVPSSIWADAVDESCCWEPEENNSAPSPAPLQITKTIAVPERSPRRLRHKVLEEEEEEEEEGPFMKPRSSPPTRGEKGKESIRPNEHEQQEQKDVFMKVTKEVTVSYDRRSRLIQEAQAKG